MQNESIGQIFKRYRQAENIRLEKVEKDIKISRRMLDAIEEDNLQLLPDEVFTQKIIVAYAKYLDLDENKILSIYQQQREAHKKAGVNLPPDKKVAVLVTPQIIRNILIGLVVVALIGYFIFQLTQIFSPAKLILSNPAQDIVTDKNYIEITGSAEKEARVYINEKEVFLDNQGNFHLLLDLQNGLNYLKISAVKQHGQQNTIYRKILVQR